MHARITAVFLLIFSILSGQTLTPEQRLSDLRQVVETLPRVNPGVYAVQPQAQFQAAAASLEAENSRLSTVEFYTRLAALVASVGDSHTILTVTSNPGVSLGFGILPLRLRWFTDGVFVTVAPANRQRLLGAAVEAVNGIPIADAIARLKPLVAHENEFWLRARMPTILINDGFLRGIGLVAGADPVRFTLRLASGETVTEEFRLESTTLVSALDANSGFVPTNTRNGALNYWSQYNSASRSLYIRYRACQEQSARPFAQFAAETLAVLDANPVETLVIDLRENGGGDSNLILPLLLGLSERIPRLRRNSGFAFYGIADGSTFSSALQNAEFLKITDEWALPLSGQSGLAAVLVGEGTGGKPAHFGEVRAFTLGASQLPVQHSTRAFPAQPWIPDRDSLYPDVMLRLRSTDYFTRHDPWLALALARTTRLPSAPEGEVTIVNAASFRPEHGVAPGGWASAFGSFPAGTVQVRVEGREALVIATRPDQIVFRIPPSTPYGAARAELANAAGPLSAGRFEVTAASPALFTTNPADPTQPGAVLDQDGNLISPSARAKRGSVVQLFGTGAAPAEAPQVWISGEPAEVQFSGMTAPGLWQISAVVPPASSSGIVPVYIAAGNMASNAVTIVVE